MVSWCSPMSARMLPTECRNVCQPTPAIPSFANAGLIIRFSTAPRSRGFLPLLRTDGNTKSVSVMYKLCALHSSRHFSARMHRQRFRRCFRFGRLQVPFPAPVVGVLDVEDLVGEVAIRRSVVLQPPLVAYRVLR